MDACKKTGLNGAQMNEIWKGAMEKKQVIKFGGGFYCAKVDMGSFKFSYTAPSTTTETISSTLGSYNDGERRQQTCGQLMVNNLNGIGIRVEAALGGKRIGTKVSFGDKFFFTHTRTQNNKGRVITFYKLDDGRGWIHNFVSKTPDTLDGVKVLSVPTNSGPI